MPAIRPWHLLENLTGKRRHRTKRRLFRAPLLVLQVEQMVGVYRDLPTPRGHARDSLLNRYTIWRDATPEDLVNEERDK